MRQVRRTAGRCVETMATVDVMADAGQGVLTAARASHREPGGPPDRRADARRPDERRWLAGILLVALSLRVAVVGWSPNVLHPDEIFQVLEQSHRLAFGYGSIPW